MPLSSANAPFADTGVPIDTFDRFGQDSFEGFISRWVADPKAFPFKREIPEVHAKKVKEYFKGRVFG